jgi:anaerobic magnesium-protoporphyrin IX monomethyl ester cyclase
MIGPRSIETGLDLVLVNSPLKNYDRHPRLNNFTLPTLGLGYIATCVEEAGFSVGLIDAEALGLGLSKVAAMLNESRPRWVGLNLLAPTYVQSVGLLQLIDPGISVMLGGHQAKAMPEAILADIQIPRVDALVLGEAETRVPLLLADLHSRCDLPAIYWRENGVSMMPKTPCRNPLLLAPDVDAMPLLNRRFLPQDPYVDEGVREAAMVASRGCPFDCSFCGAAVSANPDITIRMRKPRGLLDEINHLKSRFDVQRIRFVDDLFLANLRTMRETLNAFVQERIDVSWDATGRINVLARADASVLDLMRTSGCREVALGIESGSDRLLSHVDKKINVVQIVDVVARLCAAGIGVKGYFIFGMPTETLAEHLETIALIRKLWDLTEGLPGRFRCSAFEYRPYPGTPDWRRLTAAGYSPDAMLRYVDNVDDAIWAPDRDEFNFSTGLQFAETPVKKIRQDLAMVMGEQKLRWHT